MKLATILLAGAMAVGASASQAATYTWSAELDGAQANGGIGTNSFATGSASGTFDDVLSLFSWQLSWTGLTDITVAHIHRGAAGTNGGVVTAIPLTTPQNQSVVLSPSDAALFLSDSLYFNIHTSAFPSGEIRGQIIVDATPVPLPAGVMLLGTALGGVVMLRRRKTGATA